MCDRLAHRGPDDRGTFVSPDRLVGLAHTRLSIIDTSSAGRQPMRTASERTWIVFNGEIYNFAELRSELEATGCQFRSKSDTEVILYAYERWGDGFESRLRGMFAFAIYDAARRRLYLSRDRLGIKPLFYSWDRRTFVFASEIKAVLEHPAVRRDSDPTAFYDYLTYLYVPTPKTIYASIRKLPPAHRAVVDAAGLRVERYWDVPSEPSSAASEEETIERTRNLLGDAVKSHLVSDVPLGVFLSGGMDSSSVAALMSTMGGGPIRTFSVGFDVAEHSETGYARAVAERFRTEHHEQVLGFGELPGTLASIARMYDEPFGDGSAVPTHYVSRAARQHVTVALSGDGGDEVFAGYRWYDKWLLRQRFSRLPMPIRSIAEAGSRLLPATMPGSRFFGDLKRSGLEQYGRLIELCSVSEKRRILSESWYEHHHPTGYDDYWYIRQYWREDLDPITRLQYVDLHTYLPDDILTKVDRASMAVSLEVRPPLLDHKLVEFAFSVPAELRFRRRNKKFLLKRAMAGVLPREIIERPKKGFSAPWKVWLGRHQNWIREFLEGGEAVRRGMLRADAVDRLEEHRRDLKVWALLVLEQWLRENRAT